MSIQPKYNLIDEPWITVQRCGGGGDTCVGLKDLFANAHKYRRIAEPQPTVVIALHRLLLAILAYRSPLDGVNDKLPIEEINDYLDKYKEHFWLFHEKYPFMQEAALSRYDDMKDPWTILSSAHASGNNAVLYDHSMDNNPAAITYAQAAKLIIAHQQFDTGGLIGIPKGIKGNRSGQAAPLCNKVVALPLGDNLAQTLLYSVHKRETGKFPNDKPYWEELERPSIIRKPSVINGHSDCYTLRSKSILLVDDGKGQVRYIKRTVGLQTGNSENYMDPMVSYYETKVNDINQSNSVKYKGKTRIWKSLPSLMKPYAQYEQGALVLQYAKTRSKKKAIPALIGGLCTDKAKILFWTEALYNLPSSIIDDSAKCESFSGLIKEVEDDQRKLKGYCKKKDLLEGMDNVLENSYLSEMEKSFPGILESIIEHNEWEETDKMWKKMRCNAINFGLESARKRIPASIEGKIQFVELDGKIRKHIKNLIEDQ